MSEQPTLTRNIVLTGFMGTGKSVVGRRLAERLGYQWVDTDTIIERRHGPIREIFATRGENEFRRFEREVAAELSGRTGLVISTGGRMMLDPENAELLGSSADTFCLVADVRTILKRVRGARTERPLLEVADPERRIEDLLAERTEGYAAFRQIDTSQASIDEVVDTILQLIGADANGSAAG